MGLYEIFNKHIKYIEKKIIILFIIQKKTRYSE